LALRGFHVPDRAVPARSRERTAESHHVLTAIKFVKWANSQQRGDGCKERPQDWQLSCQFWMSFPLTAARNDLQKRRKRFDSTRGEDSCWRDANGFILPLDIAVFLKLFVSFCQRFNKVLTEVRINMRKLQALIISRKMNLFSLSQYASKHCQPPVMSCNIWFDAGSEVMFLSFQMQTWESEAIVSKEGQLIERNDQQFDNLLT
jgi:hypothetical protein